MMLSRSRNIMALALCSAALLATPLLAERNSTPDAGVPGAPQQAPDINGKTPGPAAGVAIRGNAKALLPRMTVPKQDNMELLNVDSDATTGRLFIKLDDVAQVSMNPQGRMVALNGCPASAVQCIDLINALPVQIKPAITASRERQIKVEQRALAYSGRQQPNLSTLFYLESGSMADLKAAAIALNAMGDVEFVEWETKLAPPQPFGGLGACCVPQGTAVGTVICEDFLEDECNLIGGQFRGVGSNCGTLAICDFTIGACCLDGTCDLFNQTNCEAAGGTFAGVGANCLEDDDLCAEPACGVNATGGCLVANGTPYCADEMCCDAVCEIDPFCCDDTLFDPNTGRGLGNWDTFCAFIAQATPICGGAIPDPFANCNPLSGACFEAREGEVGCGDEACCELVCASEPFCRSNEWDANCVTVAIEVCAATGTPGATPNFSDAQGYLTPGGYGSPLPTALATRLPQAIDDMGMAAGVLAGYSGEGFNIAGLEQFAQNLLDDFGVGTSNGARGAGIRVGVVEFSAYTQHEDLVDKLNVEPGQTVITGQPSPLDGNHGTACLGIIGAQDDGARGAGGDEVGVVGMTPEAELWFFPIVSAEEGGRTINAMFSLSETFAAGDIASYSIGPASGCGTFASAGGTWTMLRLLSDLGITNVLAAGNSCCNLDGLAQNAAGDCDAIIVGACSPGFPRCRLGFSNYCVQCNPADSLVHVNAWGSNVTTLGYGDAFTDPGNDGNRRYTVSFNGTSAAAPQIAAVAARIQGFARQFYDGLSLTPAQLRAAMSNGSTQCAAPIENVWGAQEPACFGDYDPDEPPNLIGQFTNPQAAAVAVATTPIFDGNGFFDKADIVVGAPIFGNKFSLDASDNNYFVVQSRFQDGKVKGGGGAAPGKGFSYLGAGQTVDIVYTANVNFGFVDSMTITLEHTAFVTPPGTTTFIVLEMWDWTKSRWDFVGINVNDCPGILGGDRICGGAAFTAPAANRFINQTNRNVLIRTYFLRPGGPSAQFGGAVRGPSEFNVAIDLINIQAVETFGFQNGGAGNTP
ncbi:MAG: S8 family serine peptidase [Phycisphaerales bacterium]|nr:S8 family serine peptidase [Phycisphaerales bacterium]